MNEQEEESEEEEEQLYCAACNKVRVRVSLR